MKRGVFQGDTLSPLRFLIAFNLVIQSVQAHPSAGYTIQFPPDRSPSEGSISLPETNSHIYALWNKPDSNEPPGWYLAKVLSVFPDGAVTLRYRKVNSTEILNLLEINWAPPRGNGRWFLLPDSSLPLVRPPLPHPQWSYHLTVISTNPQDHQEVLSSQIKQCRSNGTDHPLQFP